jgi:hypothetical protein
LLIIKYFGRSIITTHVARIQSNEDRTEVRDRAVIFQQIKKKKKNNFLATMQYHEDVSFRSSICQTYLNKNNISGCGGNFVDWRFYGHFPGQCWQV